MIHECEKCKNKELYLLQDKTHTALRCQKCNAWLGWVNKKDVTFYNKLKKFPLIKGEE